MPADNPAGAAFDDLVYEHAGYIESLLPSPAAPGLDRASLPSPPPSTASSRPGQTRTVQSLGRQPQFNLASAGSLLAEFQHMLPFFPYVVLTESDTVGSLARERPFVLLAILATVSGSRSVQGHVLYDEEFRKVLALKVVAGRERSLELVQGLLIYCGWFPFHVRPTQKRAYQYLRMAVDMVRDLELDQSPSGLNTPGDVMPDRVEGIRTYLSCYCLLTTFTSLFRKPTHTHDPLESTSWTTTCWSSLPAASPHPQDQTLGQLARHAYIVRSASDLDRKPHRSSDHLPLAMLGLGVQLRDWNAAVPVPVARSAPILFGSLFAEIYIACTPLLRFPAPERFADGLTPDAFRVASAVPLLRRFYGEVRRVDLGVLSAPDWSRLIVCVILGIRLSFPIKGFHGWDYARARDELGFVELLDAVAGSADGSGSGERGSAENMMHIGRASGIIFEVVRKKYNDRLEKERTLEDATRSTCPVLDGSFDAYLQDWDEVPGGNFWILDTSTASLDPLGCSFAPEATDLGLAAQVQGRVPQVYNGLWATMTTSWAETETGSTETNF